MHDCNTIKLNCPNSNLIQQQTGSVSPPAFN
nr:MAG TPA: hypothetical protein [Caudoviricetes sp.]DAO85647.1 MAG TPA: hypothetical protein [Caudoviricetes sp.]DAX51738.1 MAG TPA: hypothetical protein [Caudoviricetes sp.]